MGLKSWWEKLTHKHIWKKCGVLFLGRYSTGFLSFHEDYYTNVLKCIKCGKIKLTEKKHLVYDDGILVKDFGER